MNRIACALALSVAAWIASLVAASASQAQPHQGCLYVWTPVATQICSPLTSCGWCGAGEIWWQPVAEAYLCSTGAGGAAATSCFSGARWSKVQSWVTTWKPTGAAACENPVSAVYDDCYAPPNPDQCAVPTNNKLQGFGDPVDITTGGMERTDTDLDLGAGLDFTRHYSSESDPQYQNAMGKGWRHSLDWVLQYDEPQNAGTYNPSVEIAIVRRPLAPPVSFVRTTFTGLPSSDWKSGAFGAGSLEGDPTVDLTYIDADGTRVLFDRDGSDFDLVSIQPAGGAEIAVAQSGSTRTYTRAASTLTLTLNAQSRVATASDGTATWTYTYDGAGCLTSAAGPNPAQPAQTVTWTYTPETVQSGTSNCTVHRVKKISRQVGSGSAVTIGEWKYNQSKVISADEPGLDQTLCFGYGTTNETDVCAVPATGVCNTSIICRTLKTPRSKALCWEAVFESETYCKNNCYAIFRN